MASCEKCSIEFEISPKDLEFYKHFDLSAPTKCPECRLQHRLAFRNERTLYKRTSDISGQQIISIYTPENRYKVCSTEEWWADKHEPLKYGQDFDFSRPFFEQFEELLLNVPRITLFNVNPTNSDYTQQSYYNKNCYLSFVLKECQDCTYVTHAQKAVDCIDSSFIYNSELCYECINCEKLYGCIGCQSCQNSSNLIFCYDLIGCHDCIGCYGLRNKRYYIMNEPHTKEEYEEKKRMLELNKFKKFLNCKSYFIELSKNQPHRATQNLNVENSTGDYLIDCKNAKLCYNCFNDEDCAYCTWMFHSQDCMDVYGMGYGKYVYEGVGVESLNNCAINTFVSDSHDVFYSDCCFYSSYLFGCAGIKNEKYCIFNKRYSPEEYEKLKAKIIEHMKKTGEWGKNFPVSLSPFAYNETAANDFFPLSKEETLKQGFTYKEPDKRDYLPQTTTLPDDLKETPDSITNETLACINCGKNYKITPVELKFYHKLNVPIPRKCQDCRYKNRMQQRNSRKIYERSCHKCSKQIHTTYSPDRPEKIYCEECYGALVN